MYNVRLHNNQSLLQQCRRDFCSVRNIFWVAKLLMMNLRSVGTFCANIKILTHHKAFLRNAGISVIIFSTHKLFRWNISMFY